MLIYVETNDCDAKKWHPGELGTYGMLGYSS